MITLFLFFHLRVDEMNKKTSSSDFSVGSFQIFPGKKRFGYLALSLKCTYVKLFYNLFINFNKQLCIIKSVKGTYKRRLLYKCLKRVRL